MSLPVAAFLGPLSSLALEVAQKSRTHFSLNLRYFKMAAISLRVFSASQINVSSLFIF